MDVTWWPSSHVCNDLHGRGLNGPKTSQGMSREKSRDGQQGLKGPWAGVRGLWLLAREPSLAEHGKPSASPWHGKQSKACFSLAVLARPLSPALYDLDGPAEGPPLLVKKCAVMQGMILVSQGPGPPAAHHPGLCSATYAESQGVGAGPRPRNAQTERPPAH